MLSFLHRMHLFVEGIVARLATWFRLSDIANRVRNILIEHDIPVSGLAITASRKFNCSVSGKFAFD
jgi:hypothetical protein